jgi:hypothetical protein
MPVPLIEAGLVASWQRLVGLLPGASLYRHDGLVLALSGLGERSLDAAVVEPGADPEQPADAIEVLEGLCLAHGARLGVDLASGAHPALEAALDDAGLRPLVRRRGMVLPLARSSVVTGTGGEGGAGFVGGGPDGLAPWSGNDPRMPRFHRLREAGPDDLPALRRLEIECFGLAGGVAERFLPAPMLDDPNFRTVIVERRGATGTSVVAKAHGHLAGASLGISGVATTMRSRRQGLATALVVALLRGARDQAAAWSWLLSEPAAVGVYVGVGFRDVAEWVVWSRP